MTFSCDEQLGGFAIMDFYLLEETDNWPIVVTDQTSSQVAISPYENDVEATVEPESIKANVNQKTGAEGSVWQIDISFRFITRSESLEQLLDQYQNKPGIAIGSLNTEFQKMYGNNLEPLYMNFEVDEGTKIDGNAAVEVRIKGETRKRPVYYTVP